MTEISEHAYAVLVRPIPDLGLAAGDVGVVIHRHRDAETGAVIGYMLELFSVDGVSQDEVSVPADAVRPARAQDRASARTVAAE